ncbi:molecular chaperone [Malassezia caprae]|uniref:Molecular chaperone n=1 Tax=Malassezia caprae TaxID=1381934 RepID=A0AAF0E3K6_9BASI|nr:molecular chaperone [Malassezia caprae]
MSLLRWTRAIAFVQCPTAHVSAVRPRPLAALVRAYATNKAYARCGTTNPTASLQCNKCDTLQQLSPSVDYYELLGMPFDSVPKQGWQVDQGTLKSQWRRTMALSHPDRLVHKPSHEQEIGAQQSALLNKAYETLRQPLTRVLYLVRIEDLQQLERQGIEAIPEGTSMADPSLLMEVMELQEALADAEDEAAVEQVHEANQEHMQDVLGQLDQVFADIPLDTQRVQALAMQLRYWTNIDKAVREWQPGKRPELQH